MRLGAFGIDTLQSRNDKGSCLASPVLGSSQNVSAGKGNWYCLFLDWGGFLESGLKYAHHELALNVEILKLEALGGSNILTIQLASC